MDSPKPKFSLKNNSKLIIILAVLLVVTMVAMELINRFAPARQASVAQGAAVTQTALPEAPTPEVHNASASDGQTAFAVSPDHILERVNAALKEGGWQAGFTAETLNDGSVLLSEPYGTQTQLYPDGEAGIKSPVTLFLMSPASKGEYYAEQAVRLQDTEGDSEKKKQRNKAKDEATVQVNGIFEAVPRAVLSALDEADQTLQSMDEHRLTAMLQQSVSSKKEQSAMLGAYLIESIYSTRDGYAIVYVEISPI